MTLIYASCGQGIAVMTLSDILLSKPEGSSKSKVALPTQREAIEFERGGYSIAGICQKAIIVGQSIFLWSGSRVIAEFIVRKAAEIGRNGSELLDFPAFLKSLGLSDKELSEVSVVYIHDAPDVLQEWHLNATQVGVVPQFHVYAGSGAWDFLDDTVVSETAPSDTEPTNPVFSTLARVMSTVVAEALTQNSFDYLYGGWLEISWLDSKGLRKVPYAIKFWQRDDDRLNLDLPVFFSWYREHGLYVGRWEQREDSPECHIHIIPDPLGRGEPLKGCPAAQWEPEIVCHVLFEKGSTKFGMYLRTNMDEVYSLKIEGSRTVVEIEPSFLKDLMDGSLKQGPNFHVGKASEPDSLRI